MSNTGDRRTEAFFEEAEHRRKLDSMYREWEEDRYQREKERSDRFKQHQMDMMYARIKRGRQAMNDNFADKSTVPVQAQSHQRDGTYVVRFPYTYIDRIPTDYRPISIDPADLTPAGKALAGAIQSISTDNARGQHLPLMVYSLLSEDERARIFERDVFKAETLEQMYGRRFRRERWKFDGWSVKESPAAYINRQAHDMAKGWWAPAYTSEIEEEYEATPLTEPVTPRHHRG